MTREPEVPAPAVTGDIYEACPEPADRDERRLIGAALRLLLRLPRVARWGLIAAALAGAGDLTGLNDAVADLLAGPGPGVHAPDRAHRPDLRLERSDAEALRAR